MTCADNDNILLTFPKLYPICPCYKLKDCALSLDRIGIDEKNIKVNMYISFLAVSEYLHLYIICIIKQI